MLQVLLQRIVGLLPAVERLFAQKTDYIVRAFRVRLKKESGFRELDPTRQPIFVIVRLGAWKPTATGDSVLCGQRSAFGAREAAVETLLFATGWGIRNEARRFSKEKYCSSESISPRSSWEARCLLKLWCGSQIERAFEGRCKCRSHRIRIIAALSLQQWSLCESRWLSQSRKSALDGGGEGSCNHQNSSAQ
jgi:hypothetical protein